jgi:hypothetical protein
VTRGLIHCSTDYGGALQLAALAPSVPPSSAPANFIAEGSQSKLLQDLEEQVADQPADAPSTPENNQIRWE